MPTLLNIQVLAWMIPSAMRDAVLLPEPGMTALEEPEHNNAFNNHELLQDLTSLEQLERAFDALVAPAIVIPATRARYYAAWRTIVTFAYTVNALEQLIPMTPALLKAFLVNAILVGYKVGTMINFIAAIKHRHRLFGALINIEPGTVSEWIGAIRRNRGLPITPKFKIMPFHLKAMMECSLNTLCKLRDLLIVAIGTVCALRVSEIVNLDLCDLSWDHDGPGTLMLRIKRRKNDKYREGLFPRIGATSNPRYNIIALLRVYISWAMLTRSNRCTKTEYPAESCEACGSLFRRMAPVGDALSTNGITRAHVADALHRNLTAIGVQTSGYSTVSMRKGGVSAAVIAGIPHDLRCMQTGHRSNAWENYFDLGDKTELYRFFQVFDL